MASSRTRRSSRAWSASGTSRASRCKAPTTSSARPPPRLSCTARGPRWSCASARRRGTACTRRSYRRKYSGPPTHSARSSSRRTGRGVFGRYREWVLFTLYNGSDGGLGLRGYAVYGGTVVRACARPFVNFCSCTHTQDTHRSVSQKTQLSEERARAHSRHESRETGLS